METILTGDIWRQVAQKAGTAKRQLMAVAYVSSGTHLRLRNNDLLICDASDHAIKTGETSAQLLRTLFNKGVELRSRPDLHAKVGVFGCCALIGSCNLSVSSEERLTELALFTDRKQVVAQATAFIHGLREASEEIDGDFIRRILKIKVHRTPRPGPARRERATRFGNRVWLVSVQELAVDHFSKEQALVEGAQEKAESLMADKDSSISWIRWTGRSRFRSTARPGDRVIQIWKSRSGKRITVFAPCPVILRQDVDHWTRFYVVEPEECRGLSWNRFKKEVKKQGISRISQNSIRELNPREVLLLEEFWK